MTLVHLIQLLQTLSRDYRKKVFTLREMASLGKETRAATAMTLLRAQKKALVARVGNLWVNRMDPPELLEVALSLVSPSYLSFESALYRHGVLSQAPRGALTLATTGRSRLFPTPFGSIRFVHLKPDLFMGFDEIRIALPEKAWLDLIYVRGKKGEGPPVAETFYLDRLNRRRLKSLAERFPRWAQIRASPPSRFKS